MEKERLGVIFGGMSTENEVSVVSANSVIKNLDREKYEIYPIYIDKNGIWYEYSDLQEERKLGEKVDKKNRISDLIGYLKKLDILFPILHGLYGEDGTVQGLFELLKKPYVGCGVLASSIGMDKVYTKIIFEKAGLNQAKYEYVRKYNEKYIYMDSKFNEQVIRKILQENDLCFKELFTANPHVFLSAKHPLANKDIVTFADLEPYKCLSFEQGINNSFYFAEEIHSTISHRKKI